MSSVQVMVNFQIDSPSTHPIGECPPARVRVYFMVLIFGPETQSPKKHVTMRNGSVDSMLIALTTSFHTECYRTTKRQSITCLYLQKKFLLP